MLESPELESLLLLRYFRPLRASAERLLWRRISLEPILQVDVPGQPAPGDDVEWRATQLGDERQPAITLAPGAVMRARIRIRGAGRVVVLAAAADPSHAPAMVRAVAVSGKRSEERGLPLSGRMWKTLTLSLEAFPPGEMVSVTVQSDARSPVLLAAPLVEWRKPLPEVWRFGIRAARHYGLIGAWRRVRAHGTAGASDSRIQYQQWLASESPLGVGSPAASRLAALPAPPRFAVLVAVSGDSTALQRTRASIARQAYKHGELWLCARPDARLPAEAGSARESSVDNVASGATLADAFNNACAATTADFVFVIDAGDELVEDALLELAAGAASDPSVEALYSDEDHASTQGPTSPSFKPGWSPEYLLSSMYVGRLFAVKRSMLQRLGGFRPLAGAAPEYDLALRVSAVTDRVAHVARVLCHRAGPGAAGRVEDERRVLEAFCQETGKAAAVLATTTAGVWRVKHRLRSTSRVSIVIPTDGRQSSPDGRGPSLLAQCLRSLLESTSYKPFDLVVADNGVLPADAAPLLARMGHSRITYTWTGPFNFSRKINFAVSHATGEYLLLLNDDIEAINDDWLTAMMEHAQEEKIGAVGAKLFYPDGRIQHVGVVTGVCGVAAHLLHQHSGQASGCGHVAVAVRNCSAVTGACLLTRRALYEQVGGFDERLAVDFNDVDFCLKLRSAGYRIVFTPYARLYHHESASFGGRLQNPRDIEQMRQIWGTTLDHDPYYNSNLSRDFPDCRLPARRATSTR